MSVSVQAPGACRREGMRLPRRLERSSRFFRICVRFIFTSIKEKPAGGRERLRKKKLLYLIIHSGSSAKGNKKFERNNQQ
jgi:hypothetical protein